MCVFLKASVQGFYGSLGPVFSKANDLSEGELSWFVGVQRDVLGL